VALAAGLAGNPGRIGKGLRVAVVIVESEDLGDPGLLHLLLVRLGDHGRDTALGGGNKRGQADVGSFRRLAPFRIADDHEVGTEQAAVGSLLLRRFWVALVAVHARGRPLHVHFLIDASGVEVERLRPELLHLRAIAVALDAAGRRVIPESCDRDRERANHCGKPLHAFSRENQRVAKLRKR
jgi:hypothetical protein